eukprot:jgi/Ulvmu1/156/UM001_0160.1
MYCRHDIVTPGALNPLSRVSLSCVLSATMAKAEKLKKSSKVKEDKPEKKSKKDKTEVKNGVTKKVSKKKKDAKAVEVAASQVVDGKVKASPKRARTDAETPKKEKKPKVEAEAALVDATPPEKEEKKQENLLDEFELNNNIKERLRSKGIEALFPIQAACIPHALGGKDVVGRARTGCGKTLAFVLPTVELIMRENCRPASGSANVICLLPTRELAKQVHTEFEFIGQAGGLSSTCLYGGSPYPPQEQKLRRGVHIIVGTPGRVQDHIDRGTLKMQKLRVRILDECDEMLNMGFADSVEKILAAASDSAAVQTMLFSATMPPWVRSLQQQYLRGDAAFVDLVGTEKQKAAATVAHKILYAHWQERTAIIKDLIKCYGFSGRTIIFADTKNDTDETAQEMSQTIAAKALHGDIAQSQREVTLRSFKEGNFNVLVATDVAARGLDISNVELVIQMNPPRDPETYIHRSGRTGRAGATGICITLCSRNREDLVPYIEKKAGFTFERIGPPQPKDMAAIAAGIAVEKIGEVQDSVVPWFTEAARALLETEGSAEAALAKALAKTTGITAMQSRSLLNANNQFVTLKFDAPVEMNNKSYVWTYLKQALNDQVKVDQATRMTLTLDGKGAVFDVPHAMADTFIEGCNIDGKGAVSIADSLPELKQQESFGGGYNSRGSWGGSRMAAVAMVGAGEDMGEGEGVEGGTAVVAGVRVADLVGGGAEGVGGDVDISLGEAGIWWHSVTNSALRCHRAGGTEQIDARNTAAKFDGGWVIQQPCDIDMT